MKSNLADQLDLKINGVLPQERLAALLVISHELEHLKLTLNYAGGGSWQAFRDEQKAGERPTWEDFVRKNSGITAKTQGNYFKCWRVIGCRLQKTRNIAALLLMRSRPSLLTTVERHKLINLIAAELIGAGDSFSTLFRAANAAFNETNPTLDSPPVTKSPSPLDMVFQAEEIKRQALAAGISPKAASKVAMMILVRDWQATGNPKNLVRHLSSANGTATNGSLNFQPPQQ